MIDGNRHQSERLADDAGDEGPSVRDERSALQKILDAEPPEGNWKVVGYNKITRMKGLYRINGTCDKLPKFNVINKPHNPRMMNLSPDVYRLVPLWVKNQRDVKDIKVVSLIALKPGVTADKLYKAVNDVFRRKMQDEGLTVYRTYPPTNMAYIQFKTETERITFVKKYNYSDVCAPTGFHPDDTYAMKISFAFYKETQYFLTPPICVVNHAENLMGLHKQLPYHESFPLPPMYYEFVKQQEAYKFYKRPQTPLSPPPVSREISVDKRRHDSTSHRYDRRSRSLYERRNRSRNRYRKGSPERNRDRRRYRSSSEDTSCSRRRCRRPSSQFRHHSPNHHRYRQSRSPLRRTLRHVDTSGHYNPDHKLSIGERLKRIVARQDRSSHNHLKPVFSSALPFFSKLAPKPIPLRDLWNNSFSSFEPVPVTRQPKDAPELYYCSVISQTIDTMTERIRKSVENAFKAAIYNKARSATLVAFEKERQELIKNPPPAPTPKPKLVKTIIPLTTKTLNEIGPIPKLSDAAHRLSELSQIPKKKFDAYSSETYTKLPSSKSDTSRKRVDSVNVTPQCNKEPSSKKNKHVEDSVSKKDKQCKSAVAKKEKHHDDKAPKNLQPEAEILKVDKVHQDTSKNKKSDKEPSSKRNKKGKHQHEIPELQKEAEVLKKDKPDKKNVFQKDKSDIIKKPKTIPSLTSVSSISGDLVTTVVPNTCVDHAESVGTTKIVNSCSDIQTNDDAVQKCLAKLDRLRRKVEKKTTLLKAEKNKVFRKALRKKIKSIQKKIKKKTEALQNLQRPSQIPPLSSDNPNNEKGCVAVIKPLTGKEAARVEEAQRQFKENERRRRETAERCRKEAEEADRKEKEERRRKKREEEERKLKLLELREKKREEEIHKMAEVDALVGKKKKGASKKISTDFSQSSSDSNDDNAAAKEEGVFNSEDQPVTNPLRRRKPKYRSHTISGSSSTSISSDTSFALSYGGGGIGGTDYSSDSDNEPLRRPSKLELNTDRKRGPSSMNAGSSVPSLKKVKIGNHNTPGLSVVLKPKPNVPEIWDYNMEDTFYHYNFGIDDLKPYAPPVGSMLKPKFWRHREPPNDEVLPRDFFVIPDPIPKPGTGAKIRYTKRTPFEEYLTTMQMCREPFDEEETMYMEMATKRTKTIGELPFKYAVEWRNPAYEPDPEQFPEPVEKNDILEHYVDPNLTLLAPIREGAIRCTGLIRYSRLEKVAIRRLIVKPRLTITEDDLQMVKNIQEEYRTENTLLRKLKTAGLADCSFLTSNALTSRPTCVTFAPSRIHDWGLYTLEEIKPKSMIIEYIGEVCRSTVVDFREQRYIENGIGSSYLFRINEDWVIDATRMGNCARFINHSCTPNSYARVVKNKHIAIYSKRLIEAGEEITYDYKFPIEDKKIPCFCNAHNCRGCLN